MEDFADEEVSLHEKTEHFCEMFNQMVRFNFVYIKIGP